MERYVLNSDVPFCEFVADRAMEAVTKHSIWYHVCLPGQDDGDNDLPENKIFPSMDAIAHDLVEILDTVKLKAIIGFGEGAGANIILRFGLIHPNRCFGHVLINCTGNGASVDEKLHSTFSHLLDSGKKFLERFSGHPNRQQNMRSETLLNLKNMEKYADAFAKRTDINKFLLHDLNTDCLIITGRQSPLKVICEELITHMDKIRTTILVVDDAVDVLYQNQKDTVQSLVLFCKGCGVLLGVPMKGLEHEFDAAKNHERKESTAAQKELRRQVQLYEQMIKENH
uniref:Uncharacterized protein n=1 Tax=Romanomermis culicivorax TaxID=13658 RepID=A0A915K1Q9_ROMCU